MSAKTVVFYTLGEYTQAYREAKNRRVNIQEAREKLNRFLALVECLMVATFDGTPSPKELHEKKEEIALLDDHALCTRIDTIVDPDILQRWSYIT